MLTEETEATTASDYPGLVKLLPLLRTFPDALGETTLTTEEAAHIRSLGFAAEAGRWKVPPLPPELVSGNQLLENFSTGWNRLQDDLRRASHAQKSASLPIPKNPTAASEQPGRVSVSFLHNQVVSVRANGNVLHINGQNPRTRHEKRVSRLAMERRRPRKPTGEDLFEDMPEPVRTEARLIFAEFCESWDSRRPNWRKERWRKPILVGQARRLATRPPDSSWGRSMASRRKVRGRRRKITNPGGAHRCRVRRQLGLKPTSSQPIALLTKGLRDGKATFMEYARLAVLIEPGLAYVVETYESLRPWLRAAVSIDELCVKYGIDPIHFLNAVGEAAMRYGNNAAILCLAEHLELPAVRSNQPESPMASNRRP